MSAGDRGVRVATALVVVALGAIAAYVSYTHALEVATAHGEAGLSGRLLPLTIDGLVFVASMVMLDAARRGARAPRLAGWALGAGIGATVAVNVVHGLAHGPVGAAISAWPAVTLVLVVELLMGMVRRGRTTDAEGAQDSAQLVEGDQAGQEAALDLGSAVRAASAAGLTQRAISGRFGVSRHQVRKLLGEDPPATLAALNGDRPSGLDPVDS